MKQRHMRPTLTLTYRHQPQDTISHNSVGHGEPPAHSPQQGESRERLHRELLATMCSDLPYLLWSFTIPNQQWFYSGVSKSVRIYNHQTLLTNNPATFTSGARYNVVYHNNLLTMHELKTNIRQETPRFPVPEMKTTSLNELRRRAKKNPSRLVATISKHKLWSRTNADKCVNCSSQCPLKLRILLYQRNLTQMYSTLLPDKPLFFLMRVGLCASPCTMHQLLHLLISCLSCISR